jgi:nitroreductase
LSFEMQSVICLKNQRGSIDEAAKPISVEGVSAPSRDMHVREAIAARRSIRAFKPDPVPLDRVLRILSEASRAPSGSNLQPWQIRVFVGAGRDRFLDAVRQSLVDAPMGGPPDHAIHPASLLPHEERRFKRAAQLMYDAAGIDRLDKVARARHFARNMEFFGAPVGLLFMVSRRLQFSQWADIGMYMQTVMLLAEADGLASCAQEAWALMGNVVRQTLELDEDQLVYSGMALGYPNLDAAINGFRSERAELEEFVVVHDQ